MKTIKLLSIPALLTLFCVALIAPKTVHSQERPQSAAARERGYMSQTYVDTTVLRAILVLNETSAQYNVNRNQQNHAINRAKKILDDLRERAKGDPNERYALMRINEVEYQIALELEELRKIEADKRIQTANELVREYNAEIGKMRPDFAKLRAIFRRMSEVDTRQANRIADSYNNRYKAISREAMHSLEKALNANDFVIAKRELEYCERNRTFLVIDANELARKRVRFEALQNAQSDMPRIAAMLDESEKAFGEYRLSESRASVTMANNRLNAVRAGLPQSDANALSGRAAKLIRELDRREDSLVAVALNVLDVQGGDAAYEYFNEVLQKRMNLSHERAAIVDQAIMAIMPAREIPLGPGVAMVDISDIKASSDEVTSIQTRARQRAQAKADSLKLEQEKAAQVANEIYTLLNRRARDAERMFTQRKPYLQAMLDKDSFSMLELSVRNGSKVAPTLEDFKKHRERAELYATRIYALIEKNETREAHQRFKKYQTPFKKYLDKDAYDMLEMTVVRSFNNNRRAARR